MTQKNKRITVDKMKDLLVQYIKDNGQNLCKEFTPKLTEKRIQKGTQKTGWYRIDTYPAAYEGEIIFEFSHKAFNGKMRGYIYTDMTKRKIENIVVQGE